jgi:hypothetical protein
MRWTALLLAGCPIGTPALEDGFGADLTELNGCADLRAYASNEENTILLSVVLDGPIEAGAGHTVIELPDPTAEVVVELGSRIADAVCTDVIVNGGPQVRETWAAVSGTLTVDVRPNNGDDRADLVLEGAVFESPDGEQVEAGTVSWTDLSVGWFPG